MSKEMLSGEQIKSAEEVMSPQDAALTEARRYLIEEVKMQSGLDGEVFDGMVESIKKDDPTGLHFSFQVRGHRIEASLSENENWVVDGVGVNSDQGKLLKDKYLKALDGILKINFQRTQKIVHNSVIEELLK